jgi:hypothetical protein
MLDNFKPPQTQNPNNNNVVRGTLIDSNGGGVRNLHRQDIVSTHFHTNQRCRNLVASLLRPAKQLVYCDLSRLQPSTSPEQSNWLNPGITGENYDNKVYAGCKEGSTLAMTNQSPDERQIMQLCRMDKVTQPSLRGCDASAKNAQRRPSAIHSEHLPLLIHTDASYTLKSLAHFQRPEIANC